MLVSPHYISEHHLREGILELVMKHSVELAGSVKTPAHHAACSVPRDEPGAGLTPLQEQDGGGVHCLHLGAGVVVVREEEQLPILPANSQHLPDQCCHEKSNYSNS